MYSIFITGISIRENNVLSHNVYNIWTKERIFKFYFNYYCYLNYWVWYLLCVWKNISKNSRKWKKNNKKNSLYPKVYFFYCIRIENLSDEQDEWDSKESQVKIIGLKSFSSETDASGFDPNSRRIRWSIFQVWPNSEDEPSQDETFDPYYYASSRGNHHNHGNNKPNIGNARDLQIINNTKRVKKEQYYTIFLRNKLNDYIIGHKELKTVVQEIFMDTNEEMKFENIVERSFGNDDNNNKRMNNYYNNVWNKLIHNLWTSTKFSLTNVIERIRFGLENNKYYSHFDARTGGASIPLSDLDGMEDFNKFLNNLNNFFNDMELSIPLAARNAFKVFFFRYFINKTPKKCRWRKWRKIWQGYKNN